MIFLADGEVVFTIRADDSSLDDDLNSALFKITEAVNSADVTIGDITSSFESSFNDISEFMNSNFIPEWQSIWDGIFSYADKSVSSISERIKQAGNDIYSLISLLKNAVSSFSYGTSNNSNDTSIPKHSTGLDYVPKDDYKALLHRGEAVLTSYEADLYRSIGGANTLSAIADGSLNSELLSVVSDLSDALQNSSPSVNVTQNNYSPKSLSAWDIEKSTRELAQSLSERL